MQKISDAIEASGPFSEERNTFSSSIFADSHQIHFDQEGRVIIPDGLISIAGIIDQVSFVGMGETFQMWNTDTYDSFKKEKSDNAKNNLANLKWKNE